MKKGGGDGGSKIKTVDLGDLAAHRKFNSFIEHPEDQGELVPFFDFRSNKGQTEYRVTGSDDAEYVILNWYDDAADLGGGNDVGVGALGDDTINGDAGNDHLYGDTSLGISAYRGADDILAGGADDDVLVGDAPMLVNGANGGSDTLSGGSGNDTMWGDGTLHDTSTGGADLFVFDGGHDVIMDFRQDDAPSDPEHATGDKLDVSAMGVASFDFLSIDILDGDTVIAFDADNSLTLAGFDGELTSDDFFAIV